MERLTLVRHACLILLVILLATCAQAELQFPGALNLTTVGSGGSIGGVYYAQINSTNAGTGNFHPFLHFSSNDPVESAYNIDGKPTTDNPYITDSHTSLLSFGQMGQQGLGTGAYFQFAFDINQNNGSMNEYLSLDDFEIWVSPNATVGAHSTWGNAGSGMTCVYDLTGNLTPSAWIALNANLQSGSGYGDMYANVPVSMFTGAGATAATNPYIYVFTQIGTHSLTDPTAGITYQMTNNDGFEEWAINTTPNPNPPVPEPASLALLPMMLSGLAIWRRRRKQPQPEPEA